MYHCIYPQVTVKGITSRHMVDKELPPIFQPHRAKKEKSIEKIYSLPNRCKQKGELWLLLGKTSTSKNQRSKLSFKIEQISDICLKSEIFHTFKCDRWTLRPRRPVFARVADYFTG